MVKKSSHKSSCFGARLRQARERVGLAQDKLGVLIGLDESCSSARISRYETGVHEPAFDISCKLADALGISVTYLYCKDDWLASVLLQIYGLTDLQRLELEEWLAVRRASNHTGKVD